MLIYEIDELYSLYHGDDAHVVQIEDRNYFIIENIDDTPEDRLLLKLSKNGIHKIYSVDEYAQLPIVLRYPKLLDFLQEGIDICKSELHSQMT